MCPRPGNNSVNPALASLRLFRRGLNGETAPLPVVMEVDGGRGGWRGCADTLTSGVCLCIRVWVDDPFVHRRMAGKTARRWNDRFVHASEGLASDATHLRTQIWVYGPLVQCNMEGCPVVYLNGGLRTEATAQRSSLCALVTWGEESINVQFFR